MAQYARLDRAAVEGLVGRFGVDDIRAYSIMEGGNENTSYCIEADSGKYILTLWDQKSMEQATCLANLLVYLADHGIRTSKAVVPPEGPTVILYGEKPVMLKQYIEGDITASLTGCMLGQLGGELARLHEISAPSCLPGSFPYGRSYFPEVTNSNIAHAFVDWLSEKSRYLQNRIPRHLPRVLVHGDIFSDNIIVHGDQLMAIIDFEEACHYYRNFDLGMAIVGVCRDREGISFEKAARFIRGYQQETTLRSVERESLKIFMVYAAVATSFWRFRQYHLRRPAPEFHEKHVELQHLADTICGYPDSSFAELFA